MKRTPLKKVSPQRAAKKAKATAFYQDGSGLCLYKLTHRMLSEGTELVESSDNLEEYRTNPQCFYCDRTMRFSERLTVHHMVVGSRGRTDAKWNLMSLCVPCHNLIQSDAALRERVWHAKWKHDQANTDWRGLCEWDGKLPDSLELDPTR